MTWVEFIPEGSLARFVAYIFISISLLVSRLCMLYHNFCCLFCSYLPHSLVSGVYIAVVNMTWVDPVPGGNNYRNLALQLGGVPKMEPIKYSHESRGTQT
jgi:hypothetical protein